MSFGDLSFGYAAAEKEAASDPDLLLGGYFDALDVPRQILDGRVFLVLGAKGSGKSAVSEHLRLRSAHESGLFVTRIELQDFPFKDFANMKLGMDSRDESRYPPGWAWLLLLSLFTSFVNDEGSPTNAQDRDFVASMRRLKELGFLPSPTLTELVIRSSHTTLKLNLPLIGGGVDSSQQAGGVNLYSVVQTLRELAGRFESPNMHVLTIDGLDQIFVNDTIQWDILAALILQCNRLNSFLIERAVPARVVVLCRVDVFERLPLADGNKIRQDSAATLNWFPNTKKAADSGLFVLASHKASVHTSGLTDVVKEFFPAEIRVGGGRAFPVHDFLIAKTRHIPRDLLRLLHYIQLVARERQRSGRLSIEDVRDGVRRYCDEYFIQEIRNELHGLLPEAEARLAVDLLSTMERHIFSMEDLQAKARNDPRFRGLNVGAVASQLFDCGIIGNVTPAKGEAFYTFRYRNPTIVFDPTQRLVLHESAMIGLNVPWTTETLSRGRRRLGQGGARGKVNPPGRGENQSSHRRSKGSDQMNTARPNKPVSPNVSRSSDLAAGTPHVPRSPNSSTASANTRSRRKPGSNAAPAQEGDSPNGSRGPNSPAPKIASAAMVAGETPPRLGTDATRKSGAQSSGSTQKFTEDSSKPSGGGEKAPSPKSGRRSRQRNRLPNQVDLRNPEAEK